MAATVPPVLAALLRTHPWPVEWTGGVRTVDRLWAFTLPLAPEHVWPYVTETSRMNRALGLSPLDLKERAGFVRGETGPGLFHEVWEEQPWEWAQGEMFQVVRRYEAGLATWMRTRYTLEPNEVGGTQFSIYMGFVPRGTVQAWLLGRVLGWLGRAVGRVMAELALQMKRGLPAQRAFSVAPAPLGEEVQERLAGITHEVVERGGTLAALEPLLRHVTTGDDLELHRLRLVPLARRWGVSLDELLVTALAGTRVGLLELTWDVICPHCRGVRQSVRTLVDVPAEARCDACDVTFGTAGERAIEVTFAVHPSVRAVPDVLYCSAEPARKAHMRLQQRLAPGETRDVNVYLLPGAYRLRMAGDASHAIAQVAPATHAVAVWTPDAAPAALSTTCSLRITNTSLAERTFVIEDSEWADDALSPARVFSCAEFRDLFSEAYLATDVKLSVGSQTVLFTDVVGSTRFYAERGDPEAFVEVKRHFGELFEIVKRGGGAVIKTVGDAVMAAFPDPERAVLAAIAMQRCFSSDRRDTPLRVRVSVHTGPCIAVNLNTGIDFFGSTVNTAAKLQAHADAGEIALSQDTALTPGVEEIVRLHVLSRTDELLARPVQPPLAVWRLKIW